MVNLINDARNALCLLLMTISATISDPYLIENFIIGEKYPMKFDTILRPIDDTVFTSIAPQNTTPGKTYLRKKLEDGSFVLIEGRLDPQNYPKLKAFKCQDYLLIIKAQARVFSKNHSLPQNDLPIIYFDNNYLYLTDHSVLYLNNVGLWEEIFAERQLPGMILIETLPPDAEITVAGNSLGKSPQTIPFPENLMYARIQIEKAGYFKTGFPIKVNPREIVHRKVALTPQIVPFDSSQDPLDLARLTLHDSKDIWEYYRRRKIVVERLYHLDSVNAVSDSMFIYKYPPLEPGIPEEPLVLYNIRKKEYDKDRKLQKKNMQEGFAEILKELRTTVKSLNSAIKQIEFQYLSDTLPGTTINQMTYDQKQNRWNIVISAETENLKFKYEGSLPLSRRKGSDLEVELNRARVVVYYWNLKYSTQSDKIFYPALDSIEILSENHKFIPSGKFLFPKKIIESSQFENIKNKAEGFKAEVNKRKFEEEIKRTLIAEARIDRIKDIRSQHRKKITRLLTGTILTIGSGTCSYLAYKNYTEANDAYVKYKKTISPSEASEYRRKIDDKDQIANIYGLIGTIGFGVSFFVFTF